jgi:hypothetical protein
MATIVYIWNNSPNVIGHVSLEVKGEYISFWPRSAAKPKKDIKLSQSHDGGFSKSYKADCRLEGKQADKKLIIHGLDEGAMIKHWHMVKFEPERYNMMNTNCSTIAALFLEIGSSVPIDDIPGIKINDYVKNNIMRFLLKAKFRSGQINMWTPNFVEQYAKKIISRK